MHQFFVGSDSAYIHLERKAETACIRFRDQEMPPGTEPSMADIGFEVQPSDGAAKLLVDQGLIYFGSSSEVRQWLSDGIKQFPSFEELKSWLKNDLATVYSDSDSISDSYRQSSPELVTDLAAVEVYSADNNASNFIEENQLLITLNKIVRGQEEAMKVLSRQVSHHIARTDPRRPATILAIGPTGVGKTLAAESTPKALKIIHPSGAEYDFLRLDMNEYQESFRVSQLLGSPQGYVGYRDGTQFIDALTNNPRTIVLFDEIEKAHGDVLQALMNAMDAGRLSTASDSGNGRVIDCRQAIFYFSSNLNADEIVDTIEQRSLWEDETAMDSVCRQSLRTAGIAPELVGRISSFLVFRPLRDSVKAEIMTMAILRVAAEYGVKIQYIEPELITSLLRENPTHNYGARPYEYLAARNLGSVFANAAQSGHQQGVTLRYDSAQRSIGYSV